MKLLFWRPKQEQLEKDSGPDHNPLQPTITRHTYPIKLLK